MTPLAFAGVLLLSVTLYILLSGFLSTYRRYRGPRIVTCPDNQAVTSVRVNALRAAHWAAIAGEPVIRINQCSRWPEKGDCGQECLSEIEADPAGCLVQTVVAAWYEGKSCASCQQPIGKVVWHERPPALRGPDGASREWKEVRIEQLPELFRTHEPICWRCHVTESFRKEHPELVVERQRPSEEHPPIAPTRSVY